MRCLQQDSDCPRLLDIMAGYLNRVRILESIISVILQTPSTWEHAMALVQPALGLGMHSSLRAMLAKCASMTLLETKVGEWVSALIVSTT